jgi:hypothetical protein
MSHDPPGSVTKNEKGKKKQGVIAVKSKHILLLDLQGANQLPPQAIGNSNNRSLKAMIGFATLSFAYQHTKLSRDNMDSKDGDSIFIRAAAMW